MILTFAFYFYNVQLVGRLKYFQIIVSFLAYNFKMFFFLLSYFLIFHTPIF